MAISKLLIRIRKRFDKPINTSSKAKARYMLPCYAQEPIPTEGRPISLSRTRTVSWMCVPYFCLAKYSSSAVAVRPSSHPIQTLLQARSSLIQKERDLQQAVRLLPDPPPSDVHIAQVWFLVLDGCKQLLFDIML